MKKRTKRILSAIGLIPVLFFLYSLVVVLDARADTPGILLGLRMSGLLRFRAARLSTEQKRILLMVEDPGFYEHKGIDLKTPGAGLTTITQSVVKKLYFKNFRPGFRKIRQTLIALFVLDRMVSKDEQLTFFLNLMYFGRSKRGPEWGITAAATGYFNKRVEALTRREYITLIAMLIAPNTFNPLRNPRASRERVRRIEALIAGKYRAKGLMDLYYGPLPDAVKKGLPPVSYFPGMYKAVATEGNGQ